MVGGLAGLDPIELVEGLGRAPFPISGDFVFGGLSLRNGSRVGQLRRQWYDFSCGELHTEFECEFPGGSLQAETLTFCSRSQPTVVAHQMVLELPPGLDVTILVGVDGDGVPGRCLSREAGVPGTSDAVVDGSMCWETAGGLSRCGAAYATTLTPMDDVERHRPTTAGLPRLETSYRLESRGGRYVLRQLTALIASPFNGEPQREAVRQAAVAAVRGFDQLRKDNADSWTEIWRGRPILLGADDEWQRLTDAAYYYLHASAHPSSLFSTSMFGLAYWPNYHYYRGQVMWDIETFAFPPLLLTTPDAAGALLDYRSRHLEAARRNAALNGYRGTQFPWASGAISGEEAIRTSAPLVNFEQHVSLSVAHAFVQYVQATDDRDYLSEKAWPVIEGVARWLESRITNTERGAEILATLGFAEGRSSPVDNDAYVNLAARVVLTEAAECADLLSRPDGRRWRELAQRLYIPMRGDRIVNHDGAEEDEDPVVAGTPEALGGIYPFGAEISEEIESATIRDQLERVEPYLGSPMFSAPLGVFAARLGDRRWARRLFEQGYAEFVNRPWLDANEFSTVRHPDKPVVGPFYANLGGFLSALYLGLPGIQLGFGNPSSWARRPVVMPEGWDGIEVDRVWVRGRPHRLLARHGDKRAQLLARG